MIAIEGQNEQWLDVVTAISTAAAVLFAAISAWISLKSARAARDAVEEARLSRREELAPKLILEKKFLDFQFYWPHPQSLNGEAVFLSRKHWKDKEPTPPTFSLQNFGQSPALEVTIVWDLEDPNGEFDVPDRFQPLGLSISPGGPLPGGGTFQSLFYSKPDGSGSGLPLYRKWTTDIPSCSPGQERDVEFPVHLLNTFFLRGLQFGATMSDKDLILTARLSCYAVDGTLHKTQFRWKVVPFHHGQTNPIVVYGHFFELPVFPKPDEPRVE